MGLKTINFIALLVCAIFLPAAAALAQSSDPNFPTFVTTNEINGTIKARDIGDARITSYYYAFDGGQGDVFVNVVTKNFSGDIDVFAAEGLRPLTKMVIYADGGVNETGRLVYLRKGERLLLRIQGRSPNDDPATFRMKFAGSFIALEPQKQDDAPRIARNEAAGESGVRVNSVGTIIEVKPKPQPPKPAPEPVVKSQPAKRDEPKPKPPPKVTVTENIPPKAEEVEKGEKPVPPVTKASAKTTDPGPIVVFKKKPKAKTTRTTAAKPPAKTPKPPAPPEEIKLDPLASIRLVVQLKDGNSIERPMSEVQKFSVDKGVLTVITKDGTVVKYSILDVAKVTIE